MGKDVKKNVVSYRSLANWVSYIKDLIKNKKLTDVQKYEIYFLLEDVCGKILEVSESKDKELIKRSDFVFVDDSGKGWSKEELVDLVNALRKRKESLETIDYYF